MTSHLLFHLVLVDSLSCSVTVVAVHELTTLLFTATKIKTIVCLDYLNFEMLAKQSSERGLDFSNNV